MKKLFVSSLLSLGLLVFLTGCGEEAKTKEYYSQHLEEAKARVAECKKLEKFNETEQIDCANANKALFLRNDHINNPYDTNKTWSPTF
ncbi:EexN family lipoprotein [Campylobacter sp. RM12327]|uniref:EexN family lipoprotein n=1 Tax=Campylobacter sputorum TaxID=206 RepID=UPI000B787F52|nr:MULTISPECIES: EexN family lipoprotein [Campylobacter]MBE7358825.1 EexN family lipoprotein [Campylobacter sp. RM11302]MBF6670015.1 EexN family lipoprotein [Campylobacter sp. RM12327]MBF6674217.1 EexN family lipoprotein [Campylobacter sp. RM13538]MBF6676642.1 EexN family lipoprotein [Campylobacter sp. RM12321]MBF6678414.1 EexN family lipoprotein [Campylobacter sp. RM11259]